MPHHNPGVNVDDDGVNKGRFDRINFATGLTATPAAGRIDIDGSGGGGTSMETKDQGSSLTATTASIDFQGGGIRASVISGNDIKVIVEGSQKGLLAARPAAAADNAGMAYFATDVPSLTISDGSTWTTVFTGTLLTTAAIGSTVQAWDADLDTIAGLTATTDNFIVGVSSAWASRTPAQVRTTLALVIGTNVQAWDADLDAIAALSPANDDFIQRKSGAWTNRTIAQVRTDIAALLIANNLSDVASAPTSRYNIHDQVLAAAKAVSITNVASKSGTTTIDGVSLAVGEIVLLTGQTSASENGPWMIASGSWTRPNDYPAGGTVITRIIGVAGGTGAFANTVWASTATAAVTVDTTATTWYQVNGVKYTLFTASGNFTPATSAKATYIRLIAGGGGGGGAGGVAITASSGGGGGGGGGGVFDAWLRPADVALITSGGVVAVTIGLGGVVGGGFGAGGTSTVNGQGGAVGGTTSFGTTGPQVFGGAGGLGGIGATSGAGGAGRRVGLGPHPGVIPASTNLGSVTTASGGDGGTGNGATATSGVRSFGMIAGSGGGGGSVNAAQRAGGSGCEGSTGFFLASGGGGGNNAVGTVGTASTVQSGGGGGGGGSSGVVGGTGFAGGVGGLYGGGGGGGGGGTTGGNGGAGADGAVVVVEFF